MTITSVPKHKIFVAGPAENYLNWMDCLQSSSVEGCDAVCFTGGTDIQASIYGKAANHMNDMPDYERDACEKEIFNMALTMGKPMIGICRGAQFLCAMSGGILVQHQEHPARHYMNTWDGRSLMVTSHHHQRAYPYVLKSDHFRVLGSCNDLSPFSYGESQLDDMKDEAEVENCFYRVTNCLGIQSHPEWMFPATNQETHDSITHHRSLLKQLIAGVL